MKTDNVVFEVFRPFDDSMRVAAPQNAAPKASYGEVDVVILGGGTAALTAAHRLTKQGRSVLLLDRAQTLGGNARSKQVLDDNGGVTCALGALYFELPTGVFADLIREFGLKLREVPSSSDAYLYQGQRYQDVPGKGIKNLPQEIKDRVKVFFNRLPELGRPVLNLIRRPQLTPEQSHLDSVSMATLLGLSFSQGGKTLKDLLDLYCAASFGATTEHISALAFLYFYAYDNGDSPLYTLPGGTAGLIRPLAESINASHLAKVVPNAIVQSVSPYDKGVDVFYAHEGVLWRQRARTVISTIPPPHAAKIIQSLSIDKITKMKLLKYVNYLTLNVVAPKKDFGGSIDQYTTWATNCEFVAYSFKYGVANGGTLASLRASCPIINDFSGLPLSINQVQQRAEATYEGLLELFPTLRRAENVYVAATYLDDALHVTAPGHFSNVTPILGKHEGRVVLAGQYLGLPCIETAIYSAVDAVDYVTKRFLS